MGEDQNLKKSFGLLTEVAAGLSRRPGTWSCLCDRCNGDGADGAQRTL